MSGPSGAAIKMQTEELNNLKDVLVEMKTEIRDMKKEFNEVKTELKEVKMEFKEVKNMVKMQELEKERRDGDAVHKLQWMERMAGWMERLAGDQFLVHSINKKLTAIELRQMESSLSGAVEIGCSEVTIK